eukprot:TRINITY_DN3804_c0_g1_i1.p1 TRINITY_DN3804_c0_g1~~TRINITY_DN3804_c0_g1_i1.p1  ORF type:complete len:456 (+),score=58.87 TRINITY_DN3804_c0_g1_i1:1270-2637(+)
MMRLLEAVWAADRHGELVTVLPEDGRVHTPSGYAFTEPRADHASREVALPADGGNVAFEDVLPEDVLRRYTGPTPEVVLGTPRSVPPGEHVALGMDAHTYEGLIRAMDNAGMLAWLRPEEVRARNGVFFRLKADGTLRLIVDARPANRHFAPPPDPHLPNPSDLADLEVPPHVPMHHLGKLDVSSFFHSFALPAALVPYFALPRVRGCHLVPACRTMPMGWSHAVYVAQTAHRHVLLRPAPDGSPSPLAGADWVGSGRIVVQVGRVWIALYIDDVGVGGGDPLLVRAALDEARRRLEAAGFLIKEAKVQLPCGDDMVLLGILLTADGAARAAPGKLRAAISLTRQLLEQDAVSGQELRVALGRWTWLLLLRRPLFSVLQAAFVHVREHEHERTVLAPAARWELRALMELAPLLAVSLRHTWAERIAATDASSTGGGMAYTSARYDRQARTGKVGC